MTAKDASNPRTDKDSDVADRDVQSDLAADTESGDWAGEGGASPEGPATDTD